ncbi:hypothetical protein ACP70R_014634 [Stipagrostis hirtigluma subsp. patula]
MGGAWRLDPCVVVSSRAVAAYGGGAVAGFLPVSGHRALGAPALLPEGRRARLEVAAARAKLVEVCGMLGGGAGVCRRRQRGLAG